MSEMTFNYYPQFFTATILKWKQILVLDSMKQIIISSLQYLVNEGRVKIYGFVLMPNHKFLDLFSMTKNEIREISLKPVLPF